MSCACGRDSDPGICPTDCPPGYKAGGHCACVHETAEPGWFEAGCTGDCRKGHRRIPGYCALVPAPEPAVSVLRVEDAPDGGRHIATRSIPVTAWDAMVSVLAHVSLGRSAAFAQDRPYPDALARRALGALADAGLIDHAAAAEQVDCPGHEDCPRCDVVDPCPCCGLRYIDGRWVRPRNAPEEGPSCSKVAGCDGKCCKKAAAYDRQRAYDLLAKHLPQAAQSQEGP